jgi:transcription-repair coupling factor (superfamily II helicase)
MERVVGGNLIPAALRLPLSTFRVCLTPTSYSLNDHIMADTTSNRFHPLRWWLESEPWKKWDVSGVTGLRGSSKGYLLSRWRQGVRTPFLVVVPRLQDAEVLMEDLRFFQRKDEGPPLLFPPWETLPYDNIPPHPEIVRERVTCLHALLRREASAVVSPVKALMQKALPPRGLKGSTLSFTVGEEMDRERLERFLEQGGYTSVKVVEERGDFSLRGAIVDIYSPLYEEPLRFEFDGDRLTSVRRFEAETQRSVPEGEMKEGFLIPARDAPAPFSDAAAVTLFDYFPRDTVLFLTEGEALEREAETYSHVVQEHYQRALLRKESAPPPESLYLDSEEFTRCLGKFRRVFLEEGPVAPPGCDNPLPFDFESNEGLTSELKGALSVTGGSPGHSPFSVLTAHLRHWQEKGIRPFIISHTLGQAERLKDLLSEYAMEPLLAPEKRFAEVMNGVGPGVPLLVGTLSSGFRNPHEGWVLLTEEEIFGGRRKLRGGKAPKSPHFSSYRELRENDPIVHVDYGVGIYQGLKHLKFGGIANDYLHLEYLDGDILYVPVDRLNLIQRYVGGDGKPPKLDRLGGTSWGRTKKKVKAALSEMVKEILDLYAERKVFKGFAFPPLDQFYREFEAAFEYEETPDQTKAIEEVMKGMDQSTPMDRLVCGDVGYGKTEVAIRAAYRTVMSGKQVAVLVPTTVLAQQHHQTFRDRFKAYPVVIEVLSRFKNRREQKDIVNRLGEGKVDLVIGTHRLLQKDVVFRDLGLVIVDEEHRFGVTHKERLKQMRKLVDVITLTATPIPRTLQMAISGIRDLSLIQTPPEDRLSIRTFVVRFDDAVVKEAIEREFQRGGQVFFVHHRVQNIHAVANHLKRLVPEASLAVAHGQMREKDLEKVMLQFVRKEHNLLVCTSIIESGLDIPAANTILINHAERFGLADLYQLRGRVGRGRHQAYAYLLIPGDLTLPKDAMRRLRAIQELSELGSGFKLAIQDLEIRGAGNLLGPSQSGHIAAIGFELYTQLMEKAVKELKGEVVAEELTPEIAFHLPAFIPEDYVEDAAERLSLYRRLSHSRNDEEVEEIREELADRFGKIPVEGEHLLEVIKIKILLTRLAIAKFEVTPSRMVVTFHEKTSVAPQKVVDLLRHGEGRYRLTPESKLVVEGKGELKRDPFGTARTLLQALS